MGSEGRAEYAACSSSELLITDPAKALFIWVQSSHLSSGEQIYQKCFLCSFKGLLSPCLSWPATRTALSGSNHVNYNGSTGGLRLGAIVWAVTMPATPNMMVMTVMQALTGKGRSRGFVVTLPLQVLNCLVLRPGAQCEIACSITSIRKRNHSQACTNLYNSNCLSVCLLKRVAQGKDHDDKTTHIYTHTYRYTHLHTQ